MREAHPVSGPPREASPSTGRLSRHGALGAVVLIAVLPLLLRGVSCGQDFDFHLQSWLDVSQSWHQGVLYPRWDASANYGAGEPRFVFYPPSSWLLGAFLGLLFPWNWVPAIYTALALLGAGYSFRAMAREWMSEDAATLAACLYLINPYILFIACYRGAMAELLAAIWVPLLVLYGLRDRRGADSVPLAIAVAGIWLTDAPAGVMGSWMLAGLVAVAALRDRAWRLAFRAAGGMALGLGLAAFWLIPAIWQQRWVQIGRSVGALMRIEDSFLFGYVRLSGLSADARFQAAYHNEVLRTASWIVVALIAGSVLAAIFSWGRSRRLWTPFAIFAVIIIFLQLPWSAMVWRVTPELRYLQFPWRWMLVLGMIFSALAGLALRTSPPRRRTGGFWILLMVVPAAGLALLASAAFWQPCDEEDNVTAQLATFRSAGFQGTDEYAPRGADTPIAGNLFTDWHIPIVFTETGSPRASVEAKGTSAKITIERWESQHREAIIVSDRPGTAILRLMDYPAWRITRDGSELHPSRRPDGLLTIPVHPGVNQIDIRWARTRDQQLGIVTSVAALAITLLVGWKEKRKAGVPVP